MTPTLRIIKTEFSDAAPKRTFSFPLARRRYTWTTSPSLTETLLQFLQGLADRVAEPLARIAESLQTPAASDAQPRSISEIFREEGIYDFDAVLRNLEHRLPTLSLGDLAAIDACLTDLTEERLRQLAEGTYVVISDLSNLVRRSYSSKYIASRGEYLRAQIALLRLIRLMDDVNRKKTR